MRRALGYGAGVGMVLVALASVAAAPGILVQLNGAATGDHLGASVAYGDVNGDGVLDVIAGADVGNGGTGSVRVFDGVDFTLLAQLNGPHGGSSFGDRVAAGDFNGDGNDDVIVGATLFDTGPRGGQDVGAVFVYSGADFTLLRQLTGTGATDRLGGALAAADLTKDGKAEILAGAFFADLGGGPNSNRGYIRLLNGGDGVQLAQFNGDENFDEMGRSAAFGDVNNDGTLDLILGAGSGAQTHFGGYVRVVNGAKYLDINCGIF